MDATSIIMAVFALIAAIVSTVVIPYIKTKLTAAQRQRIKEYIDVAVKAAEQLFPSIDGKKLGKEKLIYVAEQLNSKGVVFDVDDIYDEIRAMIEAAVQEFTR